MTIILILLTLLNFGISWWNATNTGKIWNETKALGGIRHFMTWCGAIMAASGFTQCTAVIVGGVAFATGYLPPNALHAFTNLIYLMLAPAVLGAGWAITVESWMVSIREGGLMNNLGTAWNTAAMVSNTVNVAEHASGAFSEITSFFDSDDDDGQKAVIGLVLMLVAAAFGSGILLTYWLINRNRGTLVVNQPQSWS